MLTITTKPGLTLCFVEVPEDAHNFDIPTGEYLKYWTGTAYVNEIAAYPVRKKLPPGKWGIVATMETLTEEQAKELVEEIRLHHPVDTRSQGCLDRDGYRNYAKGRLPVYYETALESLRSAIVAAGGIEKTNYVILK